MEIADNSAIAGAIFGSGLNKSARMGNLALRELDKGLNEFTSKRYELAITSFNRAIRMAPSADSALNAYDYMARAYLSKGDTQAAINAYKQSLRTDPTRDDTRVALGKVYTSDGQNGEALKQYELAFKINPSTANRYFLGQGYLATGRYSEAERQFDLLRRQEPKKPYGDFGLGQTFAKQGRYDDAISAFQNAIDVKGDYWQAYAEMGYAQADKGETAKAQQIADALKPNDATLAGNLSAYIFEKSRPQMISAFSLDPLQSFPTYLGPGTKVAALGGYLANAGGEQTFSMVFYFSKPMDPASVENILNWRVTRSVDTGRSDGYNFNVTLPATETSLPSNPKAVTYDSETLSATVLFTIRQNASADATIDPSHVKFHFDGKDQLGLAMDVKADEYTGFSGFA